MSLRNDILAYARKTYGTVSDRPWKGSPENEVLRHERSRKWYGLIFPVERVKLGVPGKGEVDILNVKCDPTLSATLWKKKGFRPAYHMNHTEWLTILLDGTVRKEDIYPLLDLSFSLTEQRKDREE